MVNTVHKRIRLTLGGRDCYFVGKPWAHGYRIVMPHVSHRMLDRAINYINLGVGVDIPHKASPSRNHREGKFRPGITGPWHSANSTAAAPTMNRKDRKKVQRVAKRNGWTFVAGRPASQYGWSTW